MLALEFCISIRSSRAVSHSSRCVLPALYWAVRAATTSGSGPQEESISAIAFQVSRQKAADAFKEYHKGHLFSTRPSAGLQKIKEAFLPFWVSQATASVHLHGAQLGFDQWVSRWNPQRRRAEPRLETVWQWVDLQRAFWEQRYLASDAGMQIYASYKYPRGQINELRPLGAVHLARAFSGEMVTSDFDKSTRRVGPFQMKPAVALRFVREWIEAEEASRARKFIRSSFRCDHVGQLSMDVRLAEIRTSPVYVPAFVFRSSHFGTKLRTFISGVNAQAMTGTRALDETRVGAVGGLAGAIALIATGAYASLSLWESWVWGVALPATLTGIAAHYYSQLRSRWDAYWQQAEQARQAAENANASWDPEWVRAYARLEEEARQRDESQSFQTGMFTPGGRKDARGYYKMLGVEPSASKQEIQAAFRGLAMKHHPDMVPEAKKAEAGRKFQAIQEAYAVLRDTNKRRQYDRQ